MIQGIGQVTVDDIALPHVNCWVVNIPLSSGWTITELRRSNDLFACLISLALAGPNGDRGRYTIDTQQRRVMRISFNVGMNAITYIEQDQLLDALGYITDRRPNFQLLNIDGMEAPIA